jgi:putative glutamine amidotransferase
MLRIGISACFFHADPQRPIFKGKTLQYVEQSLAQWVAAAGAMPYVIPSCGVELERYAADLDGLVLEGGSDVAPESYGAKPLKPEWAGDKVRDTYEIALYRAFTRARKPVLGVCRGLQLINVAHGGTLIQDIQTELPGALVHRNWDIYDQNFHTIRLERGSRLEAISRAGVAVKVNSVHHQAIRELGAGLAVEARSEDGVIEAVRGTQGAWVHAVQWHPEFHDVRDLTLWDAGPLLMEFLREAEKR